MTSYAHPVIIIQGTVNGLNIARNLGRLGIEVYCLTSNRWDPTIHSKYCTGSLVVPRIESDPEALKSALTRLARKLPRTGVLFPTGDISVLTLASIIDEVDGYLSFLPDREVIETLVLKKHFYASLREHGVPHPRTLTPDDVAVAGVDGNVTFPAYVRPSHSGIFSSTFRKKGFVAHTVGELRRYLEVAAQHGLEVMIQEIVPGPPSNEYEIRGYVDARSEPVVLFVDQKIRKLRMFANAVVMKSVPPSALAEVIDVVVTYLKAIGYRGLFGAEVKRDTRDGVVKLLEINARSMGSNHFPAACGVNSVLLAYLDLLGEDVPRVKDYDVGVYEIKFLRDIRVLVRMFAAGQLSREAMLPYVRKHLYYLFSWDDPLPFVAHLINLSRSLRGTVST